MKQDVSVLLQTPRLDDAQIRALSPEDRVKYLENLKREIRFAKRYKSMRYVPNPKQEAFHLSKAPIRAVFGGNRSGKTTCGGNEFIWHITGNYPDWYPAEMQYHRSVKGRLIASDYGKAVREVIIPFFDEWLDDGLIEKVLRNPIGVPVKYFFKNGSTFDIVTHEQETKAFEGWKGDIAWFDEPPPRAKYIATMRGLIDHGGRIWITATPLSEPWMYDEIACNPDKDRVFVETMDIRDNKLLSPEFIAAFEKSLTADERTARIHGQHLHLTGRVYKEFNDNTHVVPDFEIKAHWPRYMCIDPHPRKATAVLWLAVDEHDNYWVYDELKFEGSIDMMSNAIHAQEGELIPHQRFIDPAMDKDNELFGGMNVRKEFMKNGVYCQRANNDFNLGLSRIKQALRSEFVPLVRKTVPRLHVFQSCRNLIDEFQHYSWDDYKRNPEAHGVKEKVRKRDDDFLDCLRYIFNAGPRFYNVVENEDEGEVTYAGTYTKYPTKRAVDQPRHIVAGKTGVSYKDLIERQDANS